MLRVLAVSHERHADVDQLRKNRIDVFRGDATNPVNVACGLPVGVGFEGRFRPPAKNSVGGTRLGKRAAGREQSARDPAAPDGNLIHHWLINQIKAVRSACHNGGAALPRLETGGRAHVPGSVVYSAGYAGSGEQEGHHRRAAAALGDLDR